MEDKMPYNLPPPNITNGTAGIDQVLVYESGQVPFLIPGLLFFIMVVIMAGGYYHQERKGKGNGPMWLSISSFVVGVLAFILFLIPGMISLEMLVIFVAISICAALFFLLSGN